MITKKNDAIRASADGKIIFKATMTCIEFYVVKWEGAVPYLVGHGIQPMLLTCSSSKKDAADYIRLVEEVDTPSIRSKFMTDNLTGVIFDDRGTEMEDRNGNRKR